MAGDVALSQALSYARDLRSLYEAAQSRERELSEANRRLRAAHRQSLRYASDLRRTYRRLEGAFLQSLLALANALEARDPYTRGHSDRVGGWARRLALAAGLPGGEAEVIGQAGRLHDVGKIGVPERVLGKSGPLEPEEWATMRRHPVIAAQILAPLEFFADGAEVVRHHHERLDGSGYPDGLAGDRIPLGARIVAVVDVYDALTTSRPYRPALAALEARRRLREQAGITLDAELVVLFLGLVADGSPDDAV